MKGPRSKMLRSPSSAIAVIALIAACTGSSFAAAKIGSNDIRDDAVRAKHIADDSVAGGEIANESIKERDIDPEAVADFLAGGGTLGSPGAPGAQGLPGPQGEQGETGAAGAAGAAGLAGLAGADARYTGEHWGVITRNTIGSAVADLRAGPFGSFGQIGAAAAPPFGNGSLGMQVSNNAVSPGTPQEKASFGNEVDFFGDPVSGLTQVGFRVFQSGENHAISAGNLPNITFEIDPNLGATTSSYSSMVFVPAAFAAADTNKWSGYIDATSSGHWFLTGAAGTATGCGQSASCTFAQLQSALADGGEAAMILTAAVGKGRDSAWVGAVDGFRINGTVYDFEPFGVFERPAS